MIYKCAVLLLYLTTISSAKIIIIGAGPSGIAAATKLLENNFTDFIVLEAENRIGGRIYTIKYGANMQDLGAQWCAGQGRNVVYELAEPLGLVEDSQVSFNNSVYVNSKGELLSQDQINEVSNYLREYELPNEVNKNYGEYITEVYNKYMQKEKFKNFDEDDKKNILELFNARVAAESATDTFFDLSMKAINKYDDTDGSSQIGWKGKGYHTILDVLMKKIPDPTKELPLKDKIQLNKEVVNINWDNGNLVQVKCKDGSIYEADRVLITTSLGVLKAQHEILFTPHLPPFKIDAIKGIGFGTLDKLIIKFPTRWWNDTEGLFFVYSKLNENPELQKLLQENDWLKSVTGVHTYDYQPMSLLGWIHGEAARKMELIDENVVKSKLMTLLRLLYGKWYTISEPVNFLRTQWNSNPHFRGSYSFNTMTMQTMNTSNMELARPVKNSKNVEVLLFAGEATNPLHYGTVHGAIETGWRESDRILKQK